MAASARELDLGELAPLRVNAQPEGLDVARAAPHAELGPIPNAEFTMAAKRSGRSFNELIGEIAELALARYGSNG